FVKGLASRRKVESGPSEPESDAGKQASENAESGVGDQIAHEPSDEAVRVAQSETQIGAAPIVGVTGQSDGPNGGTPNGASVTGADTPPQDMVLEIASFTSEEIALLGEFAPFVGRSPRRAKRFVNLYH